MIDLYNGDCLAYLRTLPSASVDLAILDPPYDFDHVTGGGHSGVR